MATQESFETLKERNERAKELREQGHTVRCWTLRNQEYGYSGLGTVRNTARRNVYMIDISLATK